MDARTEPLRGELRLDDRYERLRLRSAAVLALLLEERGRVVSRDKLMRRVWPDTMITDDLLARCIKEICYALGSAADRVRTLPRVGYAFAEPAPMDAGESEAAPRQAAGAASCAPTPAEAATGPAVGVAAAVVTRPRTTLLRRLLGGITLGPVMLVMLPEARETPRLSLAVLSLASLGEGGAARDGLADVIADSLATDLTRIPGAFVVEHSTADAYRDQAVNARRAGRELGMLYLVEGGVQRAGASILFSLRLVDAASAEVVWSQRFEAGDAATLQLELHWAMLENEAGQARAHPAVSPEEALALAQLRADPEHALAWLRAATAQLRLGNATATAASTERSIRLAPPDDAEAAEEALRGPVPNRYAPLLLAAAAMELGDTARARQVMVQFLARNPGFSVAVLKEKSGALGTWAVGGDAKYLAALMGAGCRENDWEAGKTYRLTRVGKVKINEARQALDEISWRVACR